MKIWRSMISVLSAAVLAVAGGSSFSLISVKADRAGIPVESAVLVQPSSDQRPVRVEIGPARVDTADADEVNEDASVDEPEPDVVLYDFLATAYCLRGITFSGVRVNRGVVAADPKVLPIGSIIRLHAGKYSGIYTVLDTGAKIKGRRLDIWLPTYEEAIEFGVRRVKVEIIRYGWNPTETEVSRL